MPAKEEIDNHQVSYARVPLENIVEEETPVVPEVIALHKVLLPTYLPIFVCLFVFVCLCT